MANPNDTIDPNDLDSIDALLDEADWSADELEDVTAEKEPEEAASEPELPADEDQTDNEDLDDFDLDSIDAEIEKAQAEQQESEPENDRSEEEAVTEPPVVEQETVQPQQEPEPELTQELEEVTPTQVGEPKKVQESKPPPEKEQREAAQDNDEDAAYLKKLEERKANNPKKSSELTAEEMDTLKKLIIIFGSISIVLLLTAIGIATWGALASSSAGISEENQTLIESIKVSSDLSAEVGRANSEAAESLEKKLDAINHQLELLAGDLANISSAPDESTAHNKNAIDPLGLHKNDKAQAEVAKAETKPKAQPQQVSVQVNSEITKKVSSVNYKLIKAQKTINELNSRLKSLQSHHQKLLHSVKTVEKEVLAEKSERLRKQKEQEEKAKKAKERGAYQYGPNDVFFDQGNVDGYP